MVPRRVRPGRLEGHRRADASTSACATSTKAPTTDSAEPQRARLRSGGGGQHRGGGARGLRGQPDSGDSASSAFNVRGGLQFASDSNPGFYNADAQQHSAARGFRLRVVATRPCCAAASASTPCRTSSSATSSRATRSRTPIVPSLDNGLTFRANLANPFPDGVQRPGRRRAGRQHVPRAATTATRRGARSTSATRRTCATSSACSASCRASGCSRRLRRQPRLGSDDGRRRAGRRDRAERRAGAVPVDEPRRAIRRRSTS